MKFTTIAITTVMAAAANAQVTFENGTFTCATKNANYCASNSLSSNIIIRCNAESVGQPGNCNDNLAGLDPVGVKSSALCYQSSPTAGDAACSFNGTAYPDTGAPYKIGGSSSSSSAAAGPSSYASSGASSSVAPPVSYTAPAMTTASASKPATYSAPAATTSAQASTTAPVAPPVYTGAANTVKGGAAAILVAAAAVVFL